MALLLSCRCPQSDRTQGKERVLHRSVALANARQDMSQHRDRGSGSIDSWRGNPWGGRKRWPTNIVMAS